jgi:hypothetical protein
MAAPRCLPRPTRGPDFYSRPGHFIPRTTKKNQTLRYFRDCDWPRAIAPVAFMLKTKAVPARFSLDQRNTTVLK